MSVHTNHFPVSSKHKQPIKALPICFSRSTSEWVGVRKSFLQHHLCLGGIALSIHFCFISKLPWASDAAHFELLYICMLIVVKAAKTHHVRSGLLLFVFVSYATNHCVARSLRIVRESSRHNAARAACLVLSLHFRMIILLIARLDPRTPPIEAAAEIYWSVICFNTCRDSHWSSRPVWAWGPAIFSSLTRMSSHLEMGRGWFVI